MVMFKRLPEELALIYVFKWSPPATIVGRSPNNGSVFGILIPSLIHFPFKRCTLSPIIFTDLGLSFPSFYLQLSVGALWGVPSPSFHYLSL